MSATTNKRSQPDWCPPIPPATTQRSKNRLFVYNSMTRSKTEFVPIGGPDSRRVQWYNCGPTVYDSAHMGHARSYISFDIIRRVLQNYFRYDLFFVQNVTDIDDKIIARARQRHLYDQYSQKLTATGDGHNTRDQLVADLKAAIEYVSIKLAAETDVDKRQMLTKLVDSAGQNVANGAIDVQAICGQSCVTDVLSQWLDRSHGHEVTDQSIFQQLARRYEQDFNDDMRALNILAPDAVTRVSEFVPEIVKYIEQIIGNGYAYEANGSVYFDTNRFDSSDRHFYAKLVPEAYGDNKALAEGEGDLTAGHTTDKRSANDFALWKVSKPGEPYWPSPWGNGRPGWHIECSAMASDLIGSQMDIHSGGYDLKFPHHDNEMAQSEAYYDTGKPWVHYFLHSGHLTIAGCKMSKSLKNFITIKDALQRNTWRQLRFAFLLRSWKETLDYSDNTMSDAIQYEKFANEFFLTVKDLIRTSDASIVKWTQKEHDLNQKYQESVDLVDTALCDNIDTRSACEHIRRLIAVTNSYLQECSHSPNVTLIKNISLYITNIFDIFGVGAKNQTIGFPADGSETAAGNREEIVMPFLEIIADLRERFRTKAMDLKDKDLLKICDELRDDILPSVGVRLEDYEAGPGVTKTRLKLVDKETLKKERDEKLAAQEAKRLEKERKAEEKRLADQKRAEESKLCPLDMFTGESDKYSKFDGKGMPTHDTAGNELPKSAVKKLSKLYAIQEKKHIPCGKCKAV